MSYVISKYKVRNIVRNIGVRNIVLHLKLVWFMPLDRKHTGGLAKQEKEGSRAARAGENLKTR